jgi:hypothetical protein
MRTNAANFTRLVMSATAGPTDLIFTFDNTLDAPDAPFYGVLNLRDDTRREVVLFSVKTSTTLEVATIDDRYLEGSVATSGITHPTGSRVLLAPVAQHLDDLWHAIENVEDRIDLLVLNDLDDVTVATPDDGDVLTYDDYTGEWVAGVAAAGAKGGGDDRVFWENDQTVTTSYTITSGQNAFTGGPVEIQSGATVEIPVGSVWTVI